MKGAVISPNDLLQSVLPLLEPYQEVYKQVAEGGHASLELVWFSNSIHSSAVLSATVLETIGRLGLEFDIEFYGPNPEPIGVGSK